MPITAKQQIDTGYDFTVKRVAVPHPVREASQVIL